MLAHLKHHRFSLEAYEAMVERGILTAEDRVELIHGEIVDVSPIGTRHAACVTQLQRLLDRALNDRAVVRVQQPLAIPKDSEPEPDIALCAPRGDFYASAHPRPSDVTLLVEVAETSLDYEREIKGPLYAGNGILEYWIVNIPADSLEMYARPHNGRYIELRTLHRGATAILAAFPECALDVSAILPVLDSRYGDIG